MFAPVHYAKTKYKSPCFFMFDLLIIVY